MESKKLVLIKVAKHPRSWMYSRELNTLNKCQVVLTDMRQHETVIKTNSPTTVQSVAETVSLSPIGAVDAHQTQNKPMSTYNMCMCSIAAHIVNEQHMDAIVVRMSPIQPCYTMSRRLSACKSTHQTSGVVKRCTNEILFSLTTSVLSTSLVLCSLGSSNAFIHVAIRAHIMFCAFSSTALRFG